ncbi:MAG: hypothetical protein FJX67_14920 [Alphaproteobacteria bacterium]|nr:hypothetical protein [Alphaproteobacteria bacterium]
MSNGRDRASIAKEGVPLTTAIEAALDHARAVGDHTVAACLARALEAVARTPIEEAAEPGANGLSATEPGAVDPGAVDPDRAEGPARRLQSDIARAIARRRPRR